MTVPDERHQFRILYRDFLSRIVDLELIAVGGDARVLIAKFGAMLAALSFIIAYLMVPRYLTSSFSQARLQQFAWGDEEFLISSTITVAGLCAVTAWNTIFPDRRDSLILGLIPVRMRTMIVARLAAIGTVLGAAMGVLNSMTGLTLPLAISSDFGDGVRFFVAWWLVVLIAGMFTFCSGLALQGLASQLLPWRLFLRISGLLQMVALFAVLASFFLAPPFGVADPPPYFPSFWFVGLYHLLRGDSSPVFTSLAAKAVIAIAILFPLATIVYILAWSRNVRRVVESPEIMPAKRSSFTTWLAKTWTPAPFARAILLFTARTIARSRQHRLMLAIYGGFAFALSLAFSASLLNAGHQAWSSPNGAFLLTGFLLLACAIVGTRTIFALPITLPANWIFRITAVHRPGAYFAATRRSLYTLAALPVWIASAICYLVIWPGRPAATHILVLGLLGIVIVERSLYQFRKVPFTCSWLPGHTQGKMKTGIWVCVFVVLATGAAAIELWTMETTARLVVLFAILGALALRARLRTSGFAAESENRVQFEDVPQAEIFALDLRQDGTWSNDEAYVDTIDPDRGRSLAVRARPFALAFVLLLATGFAYERVGDWRDRKTFPQVGRSFDIGGRSLNLYCAGAGGPTVVFDAGGNSAGYSWQLVEPQVAQITRACWYDRAGYGWSDAATRPRTSADLAEDLHKLLRAAGVPPPYVLVGHSFGGFNIRVFANRYRDEAAGLVLVDSADEFEYPDTLPEPLQSPASQYLPPSLWVPAAAVMKFLVHVGVERLIDDGPGQARGRMSEHFLATLHALQLQAKSFDESTDEGLDHEESAAQVRAVRSLGDVPLIVLSGGRMPRPGPNGEDPLGMVAYMQHRIYGTQTRLATLSSRGKQIILSNTGHGVPTDNPEAVVGAVQAVLAQIR